MTPPRAFAGRLHVITDVKVQRRFDPIELARLAAAGGADVVQYREKRAVTTAERVRVARAMLRAIAGSTTRLIVNDRVDVALAAGAHGVHLGADDLDAADARRILGPAAWIGVTVPDAVAAAAAPDVADYLGVGPLFGTRSKPARRDALGLAALAAIAAAASRPVVAIGGIDASNAASAVAAGAAGVAVVSAGVAADDPQGVTRDLRDAVDAAFAAREVRHVG